MWLPIQILVYRVYKYKNIPGEIVDGLRWENGCAVPNPAYPHLLCEAAT